MQDNWPEGEFEQRIVEEVARQHTVPIAFRYGDASWSMKRIGEKSEILAQLLTGKMSINVHSIGVLRPRDLRLKGG